MITPVDTLLTGWAVPGVWALAWLPDDIAEHAASLGWQPIVVTGQVGSKRDFLTSVARAARFPEWVGANWDAFEDAITDLSWLSDDPILVVLPLPVPDLAVEILEAAARFWDLRRRRFAVVLWGRDITGPAASLPRLDHLPLPGQSPPMRSSGQ